MVDIGHIRHELQEAEHRLLAELRVLRRKRRDTESGTVAPGGGLTVGQKVADTVAATMGSWRFIIIQSAILIFWIAANLTAWINHWDPYPFILLNLALSFQAAYAAPFIMMSQNRQQDIDRLAAKSDYDINIKAELEIELLHQKLDALRENEVLNLTKTVSDLTVMLREARESGTPQKKSEKAERRAPFRLRLADDVSASGAPDQPHDQQQHHRADRRAGDNRHETDADMHAEFGQQPAGDEGTDDADDDVADQSETATLYDDTGKPAGDGADDDPDEQ
jgi:uncharacterized membrane protein